ncbi:arylamine N-acetyltransferase [Streptomyces sp. ACA25]|uniref:arylamine N-acetyltransferase family protein n=1 Tax=Streptomyces sp. ACA25 TaxID=3022596 RepID=UPI0023071A0F|nr:arylamine N-acetyltransferase [Streptomyces sp. ACA25]MDB1088207.1 arylamine N-acetyltransferase [Streptomyces sp. ACA25]
MNQALTTAYLERLGIIGPVPADGATLRELQYRHLLTVPFENLSIHLREEIELVGNELVRKVVERRRGGFCYELNGAFATLLTELGYSVTLLSARVFQEGSLGVPYDHLVLRATAADGSGSWLAEVGFGEAFLQPLRWESRAEQQDPAGVFQLVEAEYGDLDLLQNGVPQYRLDTRPRELAEFEPTCWYHRTSPRSHFTRGPMCTRLTEEGRVTLAGRKLKITEGGAKRETDLPDDSAVLRAYQEHFGIELDQVPVPLRADRPR